MARIPIPSAAITIDPNNHNTVWVGTGENVGGRHVGYGDGVYRSLDGGATWKNMGLKDSQHIGMILIDPRDSNVVYVASQGPLWSGGGDRGLFKSTDGGENWELILSRRRVHRRERSPHGSTKPGCPVRGPAPALPERGRT